MNRLGRIPLRAYPALVRYALRRRLAARRRPAAPDLTDAELDFFFGSTDAAQRRLDTPAFRFFAPADFGPQPARAECDAILAHRIPILGFGLVDVGHPIRWRRDFHTGHDWPGDHLSGLKLITTEGDVKVPWELSRFHHGVTLALGYAAMGDERYAREWSAQLAAWRADNPPEFGPNWGSAMEAAIRAANWIAAFEWLRPALDRQAGEGLLKGLIQHGRYIASHLEEYWPPTNHLLANLCGLIWLGLFLRPDRRDPKMAARASREPERWLGRGLRGLARQLRIQVLPDGASYEASTAYHRFVTEMVTSTLRLCDLNGVTLPAEVRETAAKMESVVEGLRKPDGGLPRFGDEDGGRWLALHPPPRRESSGEGGGEGVGGEGRTAFPHAGWYVCRDGDECLAIRAGDNGQAGWGGHAHNDALSFEYSVGARAFLVDPGTYTYTRDPEARDLFRSTAYHNTLRVDGQEISRIPPGEPFRLEDDVRCRDVSFDASSWQGEHTGYERRLGVIHRRRFDRRSGGWTIRDTVTGQGEHLLEWFFHFAPGAPVKVDGLRAWTEFDHGPNLVLEASSPALTCSLEEGWVSPTYGRRERAPVAAYRLKSSLPAEVEFLIASR